MLIPGLLFILSLSLPCIADEASVLYVTGLSTEIYTYYVDLDEPLSKLKERCHNTTGLAPDRQHILLNGTLLEDDSIPLSDYGVEDYSELFLVFDMYLPDSWHRKHGSKVKSHMPCLA